MVVEVGVTSAAEEAVAVDHLHLLERRCGSMIELTLRRLDNFSLSKMGTSFISVYWLLDILRAACLFRGILV